MADLEEKTKEDFPQTLHWEDFKKLGAPVYMKGTNLMVVRDKMTAIYSKEKCGIYSREELRPLTKDDLLVQGFMGKFPRPALIRPDGTCTYSSGTTHPQSWAESIENYEVKL